MDIFVSNIPEQCKQAQLISFLRPYLRECGILAFSCEKLNNKRIARLTVPNADAASSFLKLYGVPRTARAFQLPINPLTWSGAVIRFAMDKENKPDPLLLECLNREGAERQRRVPLAKSMVLGHNAQASKQHTFQINQLSCGFWDYRDHQLVFQSCYQDTRPGYIILGKKGLVILENASHSHDENTRVNIAYHTVDSIVTGSTSDPTVTFTLSLPPSFWDIVIDTESSGLDQLSLGLGGEQARRKDNNKIRVSSLHPRHELCVGLCFVYRANLVDPNQLGYVRQTFDTTPGAPGVIRWPTSSRDHSQAFEQHVRMLRESLQDPHQYGFLPFKVQFQLQRLAQSGYLNPRTVSRLLPSIDTMMRDFGDIAIVEGIRVMLQNLPSPGPGVEAQNFATSTILAAIRENAAAFNTIGSIYDMAKKHSHLGVIHRAMVTPTGTVLSGPELETKNRVLRKYPSHTDHFLRVTFCDEDGDRLQTPFGVSSDRIFRGRFQNVLEGMIQIAGHGFIFLGFSHSSLRAQSCWFMSPFMYKEELIYAQKVIKDLGDFSQIYSPARCAARIGQTFSDATDAVAIAVKSEVRIADIERNDRVFTDGVGKISEKLLSRVWNEAPKARKHHVTLLQIRYKGAKGMLALDSRLIGEQLCLRPSMVKFEGSTDQNLEICGAAYKPLPMYLNRDFVKILEDLGVPSEAFLALQERALTKLKDITQGPVNAARFLDVNRIGTAARIPSLIRNLKDVGITFQSDPFLEAVVEMAVIVQLRDMKYRARIPVEQGATLLGIVDETGYLKADQVHVAMIDKGIRNVRVGSLIVMRAPARHPGDIQIVQAVDVPLHSPLRKLHNCIIFSQHGERDVPSQLSGGDLDGDLFQIIFDSSLWPTRLAEPADYQRVEPLDIGRQVESKDMVDFFVTFMQTDQLGRICNAHTQIADQKELGTFDPVCINLAEMASTAVDYSKTGIPVDLSKFPHPKHDYTRSCKPDFMANGPRLIVDTILAFEPDRKYDDEEPDAVTVLDPDPHPTYYYESQKALGRLYRAIDERKFLEDIQSLNVTQHIGRGDQRSVMDKLWDFIQRATLLIQWTHHRRLACEVRDSYEESLADTMYQYSPHPKYPLSELEVFCGTILGRDGSLPTHSLRDASFGMKEKFDRDVAFTIDWILRGDPESNNDTFVINYDDDDEDEDHLGSVATGGTNEALERSIACLAVAMETEGRIVPRAGTLKSFNYIAAAVCLQEVVRFRGMHGRR